MTFRSIFSIAALLFLFAACQKDETTNPITEPDPNPIDTASTTVTILKSGTFSGQNGYPASGAAQIIRDNMQQHFVRLGTDFKTTFATGSVTMYLSKNLNLKLNEANSFLKLAVINKNGTHNFPISESQSTDFQYVIVWCAPVGIQFGHAELK